MARFFHDLFCLGRNRVNLGVSFRPNGSGAISVINGKGVSGVTRVSQGLFRLALTDLWNQADSVIPHLQTVAASAYRAQLADVDLAAKTIDVRVVDAAGAVQDVTGDPDSWVHVSAVLRLGSTDM